MGFMGDNKDHELSWLDNFLSSKNEQAYIPQARVAVISKF